MKPTAPLHAPSEIHKMMEFRGFSGRGRGDIKTT